MMMLLLLVFAGDSDDSYVSDSDLHDDSASVDSYAFDDFFNYDVAAAGDDDDDDGDS